MIPEFDSEMWSQVWLQELLVLSLLEDDLYLFINNRFGFYLNEGGRLRAVLIGQRSAEGRSYWPGIYLAAPDWLRT